MKIILGFLELYPAGNWPVTNTGLINSAIDYIMDNLFTELSEYDVFGEINPAALCKVNYFDKLVTVEFTPRWISSTKH